MNLVLPDGSKKELEAGATVGDLAAAIGAGLARAALAGVVNGAPVDLSRELSDGDQVSIITNKSPEALDILRHSAAHIMAQAIQDLYPEAQFGIGPAIENGFYYDIKLEKNLGPDDLEKIEARMSEIVSAAEPFERKILSREEARSFFTDLNQVF